ncbi:response regulator transcription factor [Paenibacillus ginsengarvi]|uniref:DNA-binding response regulator n=1 Tax=Paenibacillus ginsengarvi TaxID=400777 RepID=A0A3B0CD47_9BACL|nr:response regulator transcription factor [Paenibacillus ginsengarvi]RKN82009.1 DNA-binding response regulator [Paenibacillus ginsengarvi]
MEETNRNHVLVVEDDDSIRRFVTIQLKRSGFEVTESALGRPALSSLHVKKPDVVVLDLNLPDMDGFEFCTKLREVDPYIAIIILTARGGDWDKIRGLELGADDYMVKPFNPLELAARIRTVLRRTSHAVRPERNVLHSGPIRLDLDANKLYKRDCWIELTPKEQLIVKVFLENPDKALSRNELLNLVWGEDFVGDPKTIDVHIRKLREKIEDDSSRPQLIETVWGLGYRWRKDG